MEGDAAMQIGPGIDVDMHIRRLPGFSLLVDLPPKTVSQELFREDPRGLQMQT